jgi:hypothetical protein
MKTGVYIRTSLAWVCLKYGIVILLASLGQACAVEFYISKVSDVPASSYSEHSGNKDLQDSLLRNAIELANQNPGPDTIEITASEPILLTSPLPALTDASTSILGIGDVVIDGSLLTAGSGFEITSANNLLDNLAIVGFPEQGIVIHGPAASGNVVRNCRVGTTGAAAAGNGICGVMIEDGASNNLITGTEHGRSIVAGNRFCGISIDDNTSVANTVQTTYIGVAADGRSALPNGDIVDGNNVVSYGVNLYHARRTLIGGPGSAYNLISSHHGWAVEICCENEGNNIVQGNRFIWDDAYPNRWRGGAGIDLVNAGENTVGGRGELGNYIDGYWEASAIVLAGEFTSWNKVVGNVLTRPRTEIEFKDFNAGIGLFSSGTSNQIGGVSAADGNVIEGRRAGVSIFGRSDRNVIRNNSIFDNRDAAIDYSNRYYPAKVMPPIVNSLSPLSGETCSCCELYVYADDADEARYPLTRLVADQDGHFEARIDSILRVSEHFK